jgi:hypothetical protein
MFGCFMKYRLILCGVIMFILPVFAKAQVDTVRLNKYYLKRSWIDTKKIVTSPFRWNKTDWQQAGVFTIVTAASFFADKPIMEWSQDRRSAGLDDVVKYGFEPFDVEYTLAVCGALYGCGLLVKNRKLESTALLAVESYVLASLFARVPKKLLGRQRPNSSDDVSAFSFEGPFHDDSFPSGHTVAVFSVAAVIANQYRETVWVPLTAYSIAGVVGMSRIYDNQHWFSDVFSGAVIGIAVGNMVCPRDKKSRLSIVPVKMNPGYGVRLALTL